MNKLNLLHNLKVHLSFTLIGLFCLVNYACITKKELIETTESTIAVAKDAILNIDTLNKVANLDALPKKQKIQLDTVQAQIVSITDKEKAAVVQNSPPTATKQITDSEVQKLEGHIQKLKAFRQNESDKYYKAHELLEHYAKSEATDLLLNVWHYTAKATRFNQNLSGLNFEVKSKLTENLKNGKAPIVLQKITEIFTNTLQRHASIYQIDLQQSTTSLDVQLFSNNDQLSTQIAEALDNLNIMYKIHQIPSNQPAIVLSFQDNQYFNRQLVQWEDKERKLNRNIRILEIEKARK